eukprot:83008-Amphidinium_carterae.1
MNNIILLLAPQFKPTGLPKTPIKMGQIWSSPGCTGPKHCLHPSLTCFRGTREGVATRNPSDASGFAFSHSRPGAAGQMWCRGRRAFQHSGWRAFQHSGCLQVLPTFPTIVYLCLPSWDYLQWRHMRPTREDQGLWNYC